MNILKTSKLIHNELLPGNFNGEASIMRSITIPVADRMECICALDTTFKLGKSLNADIVGYHVQPGKETPIDIYSGELWARAALVSPVWTIDNDEEIKKSAANAKALFERLAKKHAFPISSRHSSPDKPCALFKTREGDPGALFGSVGPLHDLIVVSRPPKNGGKALEQAADDQKADLLLCGAYTRGRIREMIIGGVTEYLINKSERPIVMLHV